MKIKLELDINAVNNILVVLGEMKWKLAHPIIAAIQEQMAPQVAPPPPATPPA